MHDSLEDYIKIAGIGKGNKIAASISSNEKILANLKATTELKKKSEEYAHGIVEFLIEGKLRPQIFLKSLKSINETLYEDVVDERAISKLCGYPICGMSIPDMPAKKFIILAKVNKVFDITERKKYCSNFCYKASNHIKQQIDNSPLWLRTSNSVQQYNLLPTTSSSLTPGVELVNGEPSSAEEFSTFTPVSAFTEAGLEEAQNNLPDDDIDKCKNSSIGVQLGKSILKQPAEPKPCSSEGTSHQNNKNNREEQEELRKSIEEISKTLHMKVDFNASSISSATGKEGCIEKEKLNTIIEEAPKYSQPITTVTNENVTSIELNKKQKAKREQDKMMIIMEKIQTKNLNKGKAVTLIDTVENPEAQRPNFEENIRSSTTIDNCLKNNECVEIINAFRKWLTLDTLVYLYGEDIVRQKLLLDFQVHFSALKVAELRTDQHLRYLDICKRLHFKEQVEHVDFGVLKPVPDYTELKEEADAMNVKTQAFYSGKILAKTKKPDENDGEIILPLVDGSNSIALRRGVFSKSISPYIQKHITELSLPESTFLKIQELIKTFKFISKDVVFKPVQCNVIAVLLINCLSKLNGSLLTTAEAIEYLTTSMKIANCNDLIQEANVILENVDKLVADMIENN